MGVDGDGNGGAPAAAAQRDAESGGKAGDLDVSDMHRLVRLTS
jgi:hypothetical protein